MVKEKSEKERQIEAVRLQVARAEAKGNFDTAHHAVLRQLLSGDKPEYKPKEEVIKNG